MTVLAIFYYDPDVRSFVGKAHFSNRYLRTIVSSSQLYNIQYYFTLINTTTPSSRPNHSQYNKQLVSPTTFDKCLQFGEVVNVLSINHSLMDLARKSRRWPACRQYIGGIRQQERERRSVPRYHRAHSTVNTALSSTRLICNCLPTNVFQGSDARWTLSCTTIQSAPVISLRDPKREMGQVERPILMFTYSSNSHSLYFLLQGVLTFLSATRSMKQRPL